MMLAFGTAVARTEPSVTDRLIKATPASALQKNHSWDCVPCPWFFCVESIKKKNYVSNSSN